MTNPRSDAAMTASGGREDPRTFMFRLTLIASLGGLLFGLDTGVIAGALVYLRDDFHLTVATEGLVVTALLFPGATAGALLGGPIADRIGRKKSLVIAGVVFAFSTVACALAPTVGFLVVARIASATPSASRRWSFRCISPRWRRLRSAGASSPSTSSCWSPACSWPSSPMRSWPT